MGQTLFPNVILGPKVVPLGTIPASSKQDLLGKAGSKDLIFFEILRACGAQDDGKRHRHSERSEESQKKIKWDRPIFLRFYARPENGSVPFS